MVRIIFDPKRGRIGGGRIEKLNNEEFHYYSFHKILLGEQMKQGLDGSDIKPAREI